MLQVLNHFLHAIGVAAPGGRGWLTVVFAFLLAGLSTWAFVPRLRAFALEVGWAEGTKARPSHSEPLANAGGLAIFAGVIVALVLATLLRRIVIESVQLQILAILLGGSFLILSGFMDDQFGLPFALRFGTQILAAALAAAAGIRIHVAFGGPLASTYSVLLTIVWVLAITNAMQFIDKIDGLASGIGSITALSMLAVSAQFPGRAASTLLLAALAGASLGFLRHNFPPARLIMGDSGAYFLGFVLAAASILGHLKTHTVFALVPTALFILLPSLEVGRVMVRRLFRRRNPFSILDSANTDRRVLSRRFSATQISLTLWGVSLGLNLLGMAREHMSVDVIVSAAVGIPILLAASLLWRRGAPMLSLAHATEARAQDSELVP